MNELVLAVLVTIAIFAVPVLFVGALVYAIYRFIHRKRESLPAPLSQMHTAMADPAPTPAAIPAPTSEEEPVKVTSIDPDHLWGEDDPNDDDAPEYSVGTRIYRIYRSADQSTGWIECDPALTERAACNYGHYIKRNNPNQYVRVNDPDGLILYLE